MDSKGNHRKVVIAQNKPKPKKIETDIQKIQRIEQELAKLDMENMLKYIDPSLHSSKNLFNEILSINDLVLKEISINKQILSQESELVDSIESKEKRLRKVLGNRQDNFIGDWNKANRSTTSHRSMRQTNFNSLHSQVNHSSQSHRRLNAVSQSHRRGKDSSVLISNLESEIMTLSQKNDQAKTLNRQLMVRLNEERANFKDSSRRLGFLRSGLLKDESEYKDKLGIVDRNCKKGGSCDLKDLRKKQDELVKASGLMAKTLAYSDKELMLKFAKKKYHKYIINKLSYQMKHVKDRHESDFRNFQEKHQHEIQALENERTYDSQIDRIIRNPKMVKFESMIEKIQEHIHFLSLEDLVGYFLNSVIELKYFSFYSADLNKKINSLEEEISEFKYIINLLEYNTQYHTALEDIKQKKDSEVNSAKCRRLAEVQYYVLSRMFLDFKDSMMDLFDSDDVVIRNHRKEIWKYLEESISKELKDQKKNPSEGAERNSRLYNLQKAALEKDPYEGFTWEDPLERLRFVTASVINEHRKLKFSNKTNRKTMFLNTLLVSPDVQINSEFNRKYDSMVNSASDFYKSSGLAKESALRDIANPIVYNK